MVAVMGGNPDAMFDLGIQELGGMGSFVGKGQRVLVKPNIGWDVTPDLAANTNPLLVKRIIEPRWMFVLKIVCVWGGNITENGIKSKPNG